MPLLEECVFMNPFRCIHPPDSSLPYTFEIFIAFLDAQDSHLISISIRDHLDIECLLIFHLLKDLEKPSEVFKDLFYNLIKEPLLTRGPFCLMEFPCHLPTLIISLICETDIFLVITSACRLNKIK